MQTRKYDRKPQKFIPIKTPIPTYPGEIVHVDIFAYNANYLFITSFDKFSKYLKIRPIKSKSIADIKDVLLQLLYDWNLPAEIVIDNESSFVSNVVEQSILNLGVKIFKTPVNRSETNGQVERCHSTIREIARCTKSLNPDMSITCLVQQATYKYNNSIHSFIKDTQRNIYIGEFSNDHSFAERSKIREEKDRKIAQLFKEKEEKIVDQEYQDL